MEDVVYLPWTAEYINYNDITDEQLTRLLPVYIRLKGMKSMSSTYTKESCRILEKLFEGKYPEYLI